MMMRRRRRKKKMAYFLLYTSMCSYPDSQLFLLIPSPIKFRSDNINHSSSFLLPHPFPCLRQFTSFPFFFLVFFFFFFFGGGGVVRLFLLCFVSCLFTLGVGGGLHSSLNFLLRPPPPPLLLLHVFFFLTFSPVLFFISIVSYYD